MPILAWRCQQSTNTAGTGTLALNAAASGRRSFQQAYGTGTRRVPYVIQGASFYEMGYGDFDGGSPGTLARSTVIASSSGGSLVSLPAGTADVFSWIDPAQRGVLTGTGNITLGTTDLGNAVLFQGNTGATLALPAIASVPEGLGVLVRNAGTAALTIDPSGAEQINGQTTLVLAPLQAVDILRVGTAWAAFFEGGKAVGEIIWGGMNLPPPRCVWANGQNLSRATYAPLFAVFGTTFGAGDGGTTFGIPDLRGRAAFGRDDMGGSAAGRLTGGNSGITGTTLGAAGGDERLHSHNHGVNDPTHNHGVNDPGHTHTVNAALRDYTGDGFGSGGWGQNYNRTSTSSTTGITIQGNGTGISIQGNGAGGAQNVPPAFVANAFIYAGV
jgi:microcystin-dependent protein